MSIPGMRPEQATVATRSARAVSREDTWSLLLAIWPGGAAAEVGLASQSPDQVL